MTELEELRLAYAECSRQKNELLTKHKQYAEMIHTCGPTCMKAGCVNRRLREAAQGALNALETLRRIEDLEYGSLAKAGKAITQLRAALGEGK